MSDSLSLNINDLLLDEDEVMSRDSGIGQNIYSSADVPAAGTVEIDVDKLHSFRNHPFKVIYNKDMDALTGSVKESGIITPLIVRKDGDGYEIISGHRRKSAAQEAGLKAVPCIIVDYDDEEASLCMCNSNLQREKLFPSERAKYVYIKYNILMKRRNLGTVSEEGRTRNVIAKEFGMSPTAISRCLALYKLGEQFMELVDQKKISEGLATEKVSQLSEKARDMVIARIVNYGTKFDASVLDELIEEDKVRFLTQEKFDEIVDRYEKRKEAEKEKSKQQKGVKSIQFDSRIADYFPASYTSSQIQAAVFKLLEKSKDSLLD